VAAKLDAKQHFAPVLDLPSPAQSFANAWAKLAVKIQ